MDAQDEYFPIEAFLSGILLLIHTRKSFDIHKVLCNITFQTIKGYLLPVLDSITQQGPIS